MNFAGTRAFARHMLSKGVSAQPFVGGLHSFGGIALEGILFRDGPWQVEMVALFPNAVVPKHKHNRVDSFDLALGGGGLVIVENRVMPQERRGAMAANLLHIGRGKWHNGHAGPDGAIYLSFQHWEGEPSLISEDWQAW